MRCPVCKPALELQPQALESSLTVHGCPNCHGSWVRAADYWRWRAEHTPSQPSAPPSGGGARPEPADTEGLKLCPDDGHILGRYRVGHGLGFAVDHCRNCDGVWLDANEWEALRQAGVHEHLPEVYSDEWQREVRAEDRREREQAQWTRQLGEADFARVREVRAWIDAHPHRSELYAFLNPANQPLG
ncbi:MAG TPA: zf-TFIIB domain-containing protein [Longimicrobium sp.]|nr:zf-TFIIB domain-containing protein [Longimicrobium sp.]